MNKKQILKDPETWANKVKIKDLESVITQCKDAYYNTSKSILPDDVYDIIEEVLRERKPKSKALSIGAEVLNDVKLPVGMYSLGKVKNENTFYNFMESIDENTVLSDKLDGVSILVCKIDRKYKLYTRGNGIKGKDISAYAPYLKGLPNISKVPEGFMGRGEMIMSEANFKKWESSFANARNMVSGLTNRKDIHTGLSSVNVVMYERIDKKLRPSRQLQSLKKLGFKTVYYTEVHSPDFNDMVEYLNIRKKQSKYAIDGIVIYEDLPHKYPTSNPDYAIAFKINSESDMKVVTVTDVKWQPSRQGRLTPVITIEPTKMQGVVITNVTAHNGANVLESGIGKGSKVRIIRSGDVIPMIVEVVKPVKVLQPKNTILKGKFLYTTSEDHTDTIQTRAIEHFFNVIGVDGFKIGSVVRMYESGYDTIPDLLETSKKDFVNELGINGGKIYDSITKAKNSLTLPTLMAATGLFENWSTKRLSLLISKIGDPTKKLDKSALRIPSIGPELIKTFLNGLPSFKTFLKETKLKYTLEDNTIGDGKLNGQTIVFTGFRDKDLQAKINKEGGVVADSVTKSTTMVVTKDGNSSSKTQKAISIGIPVITYNNFIKKYIRD